MIGIIVIYDRFSIWPFLDFSSLVDFVTKIIEKRKLEQSKLMIKTESTRKSSNIYLSWTKIEYQNNLNPIALFSTLNKR